MSVELATHKDVVHEHTTVVVLFNALRRKVTAIRISGALPDSLIMKLTGKNFCFKKRELLINCILFELP